MKPNANPKFTAKLKEERMWVINGLTVQQPLFAKF